MVAEQSYDHGIRLLEGVVAMLTKMIVHVHVVVAVKAHVNANVTRPHDGQQLVAKADVEGCR